MKQPEEMDRENRYWAKVLYLTESTSSGTTAILRIGEQDVDQLHEQIAK